MSRRPLVWWRRRADAQPHRRVRANRAHIETVDDIAPRRQSIPAEPDIQQLEFARPHGGGTKYTAIAIHKDEATRAKHEEMGFHEGWAKALDQLVEHVKSM